MYLLDKATTWEASFEHPLLLDGADVDAYEKHYKLFLRFWIAGSQRLNPFFLK
jgi:hypothetical protein